MSLAKTLIESIDERIRRGVRSVRTSHKSSIDPAYAGSGNPKTKRPGEASAANITKRHIAAYSLKAMSASDNIVETQVGEDTVIDGAISSIGDSGLITAAQLAWVTSYWVTPGNINTLPVSITTERSVFGDVFTDVKEVRLGPPGRYRVSLQLARSGAAAPECKLEIKMPDGTRIAASNLLSTPSAVYPSFGAATNLDMNMTAPMNANLYVMLHSTVTGQTAYIRNVIVRYTATETLPNFGGGVIVD